MLSGTDLSHFVDDGAAAAAAAAHDPLSPAASPPPPLFDVTVAAAADDDEAEEQLEGWGTAESALDAAVAPSTPRSLMSDALSSNDWSLERLFEQIPPGACDKILELMPFAASYTGGHPDMVHAMRRRLLNTDGVSHDGAAVAAAACTRRRRDVTNIPTIDIGGTSIYDPWQRQANASAALASGYGRSDAVASRQVTGGVVRDASTWIEAVAQLEPVLNRDEDAVHPFAMHALITAFLVRLATERYLRARPVRAAALPPPPPPPPRKRRAI